MYELFVETLNANTNAINHLAEVLVNMNVPASQQNTIPVHEEETEGKTPDHPPICLQSKAELAGPVVIPDIFINDAAKREWLVKHLSECDVDIPPRTKTTTLEKKWADIVEAAQPSTTSPPPPAKQAPAAAPAQVGYSKAQVAETLKAYAMSGKDEADKLKRQDEIRAKLGELGAANVSGLDESHYATIIKAFKE